MGENKLLSPLNDIVFKALFGREEKESKIILIDFLNAILSYKGEDKIVEIDHLNPFNLKEFKGDKGSILDLKVKTEKDERINIEVQVNDEDDFRKRSLYYWSKMYGETISESEAYMTLKKSIVINIMDFIIIDETDRYHTEYKILETEDHFPLIDDLSIHYIELPKFNSKEDIEYMEAVELWLTFLKNTGRSETEDLLTCLVERSETIKMAKEMLERISADELLRQKYYAREKARLDAVSRIKYAEIKGMEKGRKEGKEEGKIEIAIKLMKMKMPLEDIAEITGLSEEELKRL